MAGHFTTKIEQYMDVYITKLIKQTDKQFLKKEKINNMIKGIYEKYRKLILIFSLCFSV